MRSAKNIAEVRQMATSKLAGSNGWIWASAWRKDALVRPSACATRRAWSSMRADRSTPSAEPDRATRAASRVFWPLPQPTSSTRSVGWMAAASWNGRSWPAMARSKYSACAAQ
jgi:hypothetical protein